MTGLLMLLALGLVLALGLATGGILWKLTHPPRRTYAWAVAKGLAGDPGEMAPARRFESFDLAEQVGGSWRAIVGRERCGEGMLVPCWDIAGDDPDGPVVIMTPGWGEGRVNALVRLSAVASGASRVLVWDPPGLGEAPGRCALGTREHRVLARLIEHAGAGGRGVVLYGWSMGAGISLAAAVDEESGARVVGVIAEAPYRLAMTPARNVIRMSGMPWAVAGPCAFALMGVVKGLGPGWRGFDRAGHAARVRCPVLVMHGDADAVCPVDDGRVVAAAAARGRMVEIAGGGHLDLWTDARFAPACGEAVRAFIREVGRPAA